MNASELQEQFVFQKLRDECQGHIDGMVRAVHGVVNGHAKNIRLIVNCLEVVFRMSTFLAAFTELQMRSFNLGDDVIQPVKDELAKEALAQFEKNYKLTKNAEGKIVPLADRPLVEVPKLVVVPDDPPQS